MMYYENKKENMREEKDCNRRGTGSWNHVNIKDDKDDNNGSKDSRDSVNIGGGGEKLCLDNRCSI